MNKSSIDLQKLIKFAQRNKTVLWLTHGINNKDIDILLNTYLRECNTNGHYELGGEIIVNIEQNITDELIHQAEQAINKNLLRFPITEFQLMDHVTYDKRMKSFNIVKKIFNSYQYYDGLFRYFYQPSHKNIKDDHEGKLHRTSDEDVFYQQIQQNTFFEKPLNLPNLIEFAKSNNEFLFITTEINNEDIDYLYETYWNEYNKYGYYYLYGDLKVNFEEIITDELINQAIEANDKCLIRFPIKEFQLMDYVSHEKAKKRFNILKKIFDFYENEYMHYMYRPPDENIKGDKGGLIYQEILKNTSVGKP